MRIEIKDSIIELVEGDITEQTTEAIVNAANRTLLGGGGVDGAIHKAGGPRILEECRRLGGCDPGDAKITSGGNLLAPYVIHAVGPVYRDGRRREAEILAKTYTRCLEVAVQNNIRTISFPSISTGAYGYPMDEAARIALQTVKNFLETHNKIKLVRFVLYGQRAYEEYLAALEEIMEEESVDSKQNES